MNLPVMKLIDDLQQFYKFIYNLLFIKLKLLKTCMKINPKMIFAAFASLLHKQYYYLS